MDFAQARVGNLGHMASPKMLKCSECGHSKGRGDYAGSQWSEGSKNRQCIVCRKRLQGAADAPCTLETMPAPGIPNTHTHTHTRARVFSLSFLRVAPQREREREKERGERGEREKERERRSSGITLCPLLVLSLFPKKREEERVEKEERKRERKREREGSAVSHYAPSLY